MELSTLLNRTVYANLARKGVRLFRNRVVGRLRNRVRRLRNRIAGRLRRANRRFRYQAVRLRSNSRPIPHDGQVAAVAPDAVFGLFDKVFVISLQRSEARRRYVSEHLRSIGIGKFEFFDATDADDPLVETYYRSGRVQGFPPCFRCHTRECGNPKCNNILKPAQVATFLTSVRLWRAVAAGCDGRVLVLEDDVAFQSYAPAVLRRLNTAIERGQIPFSASTPVLLRLGWVRNHEASDREFVDTGTLKFTSRVRMSNPCYAMTRSFAQEILTRFHRIETTSDDFLHARNADVGWAYTVFPPIATEQSWSSGEMPSEIHPNPKHADYLRKIGDGEAADLYTKSVLAAYVKRVTWRPLVISGHPRCGSKFAADICQQMGLDVGHERVGAAGVSSWMFAVDGEAPFAFDELAGDRRRLAWDDLVMQVRNLPEAIPSVIREHQHAPAKGFSYLRNGILEKTGIDLNTFDDDVERAAWSIILWCQIVVDQRPSLIFRIEDQADVLAQFLRDKRLVPLFHRRTRPVPTVINADKPYLGVRYKKPNLTADEIWAQASPELREAMRRYDDFFGYRSNWPIT